MAVSFINKNICVSQSQSIKKSSQDKTSNLIKNSTHSDSKLIKFGDKRLDLAFKANAYFLNRTIPVKEVNSAACEMLENTNSENTIKLTPHELEKLLDNVGTPEKKLKFTATELKKLLEEVKPDNCERKTTVRKLEDTLLSVLKGIDPVTERHSKAVKHVSLALAKKMGIVNKSDLQVLEFGTDCHDIGKCIFPSDAFANDKPLSLEIIKTVLPRHPKVGADILKSAPTMLKTEEAKRAVGIVEKHHEIEAKEHSLEEKIIIVADAVVAAITRKSRRGQAEGYKSDKDLIEDLKQNSSPNPDRNGIQQFDKECAFKMIEIIEKQPEILEDIKNFVVENVAILKR